MFNRTQLSVFNFDMVGRNLGFSYVFICFHRVFKV
jgi:hypothetical protein